MIIIVIYLILNYIIRHAPVVKFVRTLGFWCSCFRNRKICFIFKLKSKAFFLSNQILFIYLGKKHTQWSIEVYSTSPQDHSAT